MDVDGAAAVLAEQLAIDETRDVVHWRAPDGGEPRQIGLHDYRALYAVPGLYEAVYLVLLGLRSPQLLTEVLASLYPPGRRAELQVLDVGAGTGCVGSALSAAGFRRIAGTDLEPASMTAIGRDRSHIYTDLRVIDLSAPTPADAAWLTRLAPDVVTVAGAIGWGHLPLAAVQTLTRLLRPGALLAATVSQGYASVPELAGYAQLFTGAGYRQRARRDGLHRWTTQGRPLNVTALVLERTHASDLHIARTLQAQP